MSGTDNNDVAPVPSAHLCDGCGERPGTIPGIDGMGVHVMDLCPECAGGNRTDGVAAEGG